MVITLVDDGDAHRGAREFLSGGQPTEAGPTMTTWCKSISFAA